MRSTGYIELVGGIPRRRSKPNLTSEAFTLGYMTAQLHTGFNKFLEEQQRAAAEIGGMVGSLLPLLLALQGATAASGIGEQPLTQTPLGGGGLMGLLNVLPPPPPTYPPQQQGNVGGGLAFLPPPNVPVGVAPGSAPQGEQGGG